MSFLALLLCVNAIAIGVESHVHEDITRKCVHSQHVEPALERLVKTIESIPMETHRSANAYYRPASQRKLLAVDEPQPLRIHVEYQIDNLPEAQQIFMKTDLLPAVKAVFHRALDVKRPVPGRLKLPRACVSTFVGYPGFCHQVTNECGTARHNLDFFGKGRTCVQPYDDRMATLSNALVIDGECVECTELPEGNGVENADFILYVTSQADAGCISSTETVASAGFCVMDTDSWYDSPNRPLAGVANFCPNNVYTEANMFGYMLDTAVHEVLHALTMSKQLFEKFIDEDEKPRQSPLGKKPDGSLVIQTPKVVEAARDILGCNSMEGGSLENEGGYGTAESHWERRLFMGELMIGSSSASSRVVFSNLTLALCGDSGWYLPKFVNSGVLRAVEHRGCEFVESNCHTRNEALEETFCWDDRPANQQPAICTPDHMAIGYCKNDMSLMGDCSVVQSFKNTHCTNAAHGTETQHVDLGMRHKFGARCFPVDSYKISRTENYYTVFRSDLGATCFDSVCKDGTLHIRIPATSEHEQKDIPCPSGEKVSLADHDLGFDEGTIGPCPNNQLVCESWGCEDDCNSNGMCLDGECHCNIGFVGKSCKAFACPHHQCDEGMECDTNNGECYPSGQSKTPKPEPERERKPEPEPTKPTKPEPKPPKTPLAVWPTHRPSTPYKPKASPKPKLFPYPDEGVEGFEAIPVVETVPSPKEKGPKEEGLVPFTSPKGWPKPSRPLRSPDIEKQPGHKSPSAFGVPAYLPQTPPAGDKFASGRAVAVGYLRGCLLFEDTHGDMRIRPDTVRRYTDSTGEWLLEPFPKVDNLVIDPKYADCYDVFTNLRPLWRMRGFKTVRTLSGISTLAALTPKAKSYTNDNVTEFYYLRKDGSEEAEKTKMEKNKYPGYALEADILAAMGLQDKYILQRDFVTETWATEDDESRRAVVYNAMISNTVIQISCFMDGKTKPSYRTSDKLFRLLGQFLESGIALDKLVHVDTVYDLVSKFSAVQTNSRNSWIVAEAIANTNQLAYRHLAKYEGLDLLKATARLTVASQTELCRKAARLESGAMEWFEYSRQTSKHRLKNLLEDVSIPDIAAVMKQSVPNSNDMEEERETALGLPYLDTQWKETAFVGVVMFLLILVTCSVIAAWSVRRKRY